MKRKHNPENRDQSQFNYKFKKLRVSSPIEMIDDEFLCSSTSGHFQASYGRNDSSIQYLNNEYESHHLNTHLDGQQNHILNQEIQSTPSRQPQAIPETALQTAQSLMISTRSDIHQYSYSPFLNRTDPADYSAGNIQLGHLVQERRRQREEELARKNFEYYEKQNRELGSFRSHQHG